MKMLKTFSVTGLIILATLFIQACSKNNDYNNNPTGVVTQSDSVTIQGMQFLPATRTVTVGTKVTWTNLDVDTHTVTSDDGTSFSSGNITTNGKYSYTFTSNGSFPYHCTLHSGMTGTILVVNK
jgi:plastocyanin